MQLEMTKKQYEVLKTLENALLVVDQEMIKGSDFEYILQTENDIYPYQLYRDIESIELYKEMKAAEMNSFEPIASYTISNSMGILIYSVDNETVLMSYHNGDNETFLISPIEERYNEEEEETDSIFLFGEIEVNLSHCMRC